MGTLTKRTGLVLLLLTLAVALPGVAHAALDRSFGDNGVVLSDFGFGDDVVLDLAVQPDGKIIVAGYVFNGAVKNLAVARYLPSGELDLSFSAGGFFTLSLANGDTRADRMDLLADGTIMVTAAVDDIQPGLGVIRLTADGFLDITFGDNGRVLFPDFGGKVVTTGLGITEEGAIVAAAVGDEEGAESSFFVKLDQQGDLDRRFGNNGMARVALAEPWAVADFVLTEEGKILAGGVVYQDGVPQAGMVRLNPDGSLDSAFAGAGKALMVPVPAPSLLRAISLDHASGVLLAGYATVDGLQESFVAKVSADGAMDGQFGNSGVFLSSLGLANHANAVVGDEHGTVWVTGTISDPKGSDLYLLSLATAQEPSGEVDPASNGSDQATDGGQTSPAKATTDTDYQIIDIDGSQDVGHALGLSPEGALLVAGASAKDDNFDFALLSFGDTPEGGATTPESASAVNKLGYTLVTAPVTGITRVGALSGGTISISGQQSCRDYCAGLCGGKTDDACFTGCLQNCSEGLSVVLRGVVYSVKPQPTYRSSDEQDEQDEDVDETKNEIEDDKPEGGNVFPPSVVGRFFVDFGQTEDGTGDGAYVSDIDGITPGTRYYVRAYAVLSDDTIIYGDERSFSTDDACFIATAAFGSILERQVVVLRTFRDRFLLSSWAGQQFVGLYYRVSPPLAQVVADYGLLRLTVRLALLPVILFAMVAVQTTPMISLGLLAAILAALLFGVRESTRRWGSKTCR